MLSCKCIFDPDDCDWFYYHPNDFTTLKTKRGRRCSSCKNLIKVGSVCARFDCVRYPKDEIEEKIYGSGNEIYKPPFYLCERCGEIWFNLTELGYCLDPLENLENDLKEYWKLTGFNVIK